MNLFLIGYDPGGIDVEPGRRALESYLAESPRWGDAPICRTASVSSTGSIDFADQTRACE